MLKAIILDIDGVIVGEKIEYNSPHPHADVLKALKTVREKGISVVLCTAKPHFAIGEIITDANLHNLHVTEAGAVIIDPIDNTILEEQTLEKTLAKEILEVLVKKNIYTEFYTNKDYFIQENHISAITKMHTHILQRQPKVLKDIADESVGFRVTKIIPIAKDRDDKNRVIDVLKQFEKSAAMSWTVHPVAVPLQFGIVTKLGITKKHGVEAIIRSLHISFDEVLGVGDSTSDWQFIEICRFGATLANGSSDLKEYLKTKGEGKFFISAKSVDENGILDILQHFAQ